MDHDKEKDRLDKMFELGLLLITVLAASELGYSSIKYANDLGQVTFVFRGLTIPIIVLIMLWIVSELTPSLPIKKPLRRVAKEFCWALFANFFVFEIIVFVALGFTSNPTLTGYWGQAVTLLAFLITIPVIWRYREAERIDVNERRGRRVAGAIAEDAGVYVCAYFSLLAMLLASGFLPLP